MQDLDSNQQISRSSDVIRNIAHIKGIPVQTLQQLEPVTRLFEFRISRYYADLIDWTDPDDPLRQIVLPHSSEIESDLDIDASREVDNTPVHGVQHKYRPTALLLVNDVCSSYCRFCFRKRFTLSTSNKNHILPPGHQNHDKETSFNIQEGIAYIAQHPEINNVLLTGGDPLMLSVTRLEPILKQLCEVPHIQTIRIGSKVPAFDPERLSNVLLDTLAHYNTPKQRIYLMLHFSHPRELTLLACQKLEALLSRRLILCNQTPLLRGVNDTPETLVALHVKLASVGVTPYYVFHCRPTYGNERFMISIQEGLQIVSAARAQLSGLAKRFRYVGSHSTGKIEIVGQLHDQIILRYHEAKDPENENKLFTWPVDQTAFWFDDMLRVQGE
ncbi:MAG TPA: KamA family radical SAM protein [Ktedonobacteraceae bacterium]|nr:KamA family radical SAM protein [Ktedonobacteraceae bacterium]